MTTWNVLSRKAGSWASSVSHASGERLRVGHPPRRRRQRIDGDRRAFEGPDQTDAAFDGAVVEHDAWCRDLHCCPVRLAVDEQPATALGALVQGVGERQRLVAVSARNGEDLRLGAGPWMGVDRAPLDDPERRGRDGLDAGIVGARRNGALDLGLQQRLERLE